MATEDSVESIRLHLPGGMTVGEAVQYLDDYQPITEHDRRVQAIGLALASTLRERVQPGVITEARAAANLAASEAFLHQPEIVFPADQEPSPPPA